MKSKLISQIERELEMIMDTDDELAINKHLYTIETLAKLAQDTQNVKVSETMTTTKKPVVTETELRMMGAKVQEPKNNTITEKRAVTDDGFGNGQSLFDF